MDIKREKKRVCYIESKPEWFSYAVMRLFYRNPSWLFVPLRDISTSLRIEEYKKATYFFVSGYGHPDEAKTAKDQGCNLVGVRADIPKEISILECKEWDAFGAYALIRFYFFVNSLPKPIKAIVKNIFIFFSKIIWYLKFSIKVFKNDNFKSALTKAKKFLNIS